MDLQTLVGAIGRHRIAVLLVLVATAVAVVQVPRGISSEYEAVGSVVLLSPSSVPSGTGEDVNVNPWARFGPTEAAAAAALTQVLRSPSRRELVVGDGELVKTYDIGTNAANGAIIDIRVIGATEASTLAAFDVALQTLERELEGRQEASGAEPPTWLRADVLTRPEGATELPGAATRAMAAVGAIGVIAAASAAIVLDTLGNARRRRASLAAGAQDQRTADAEDLAPGELRVLKQREQG